MTDLAASPENQYGQGDFLWLETGIMRGSRTALQTRG